jgi:hypothetical protein
VTHTGRSGERPPGELLLQVFDPPGPLGHLERTVGVDDRDAGRVVPAVLQQPQSVHHDIQRVAWPDVADDAAHGSIVYVT